jgi:hypothetical protein
MFLFSFSQKSKFPHVCNLYKQLILFVKDIFVLSVSGTLTSIAFNFNNFRKKYGLYYNKETMTYFYPTALVPQKREQYCSKDLLSLDHLYIKPQALLYSTSVKMGTPCLINMFF